MTAECRATAVSDPVRIAGIIKTLTRRQIIATIMIEESPGPAGISRLWRCGSHLERQLAPS